MTNQISNFIAQASYNGVNLLSNNSAAKTFLADTSATTLTMAEPIVGAHGVHDLRGLDGWYRHGGERRLSPR